MNITSGEVERRRTIELWYLLALRASSGQNNVANRTALTDWGLTVLNISLPILIFTLSLSTTASDPVFALHGVTFGVIISIATAFAIIVSSLQFVGDFKVRHYKHCLCRNEYESFVHRLEALQFTVRDDAKLLELGQEFDEIQRRREHVPSFDWRRAKKKYGKKITEARQSFIIS